MTFPLDRAVFAEAWLENRRKVHGTVSDIDREFGEALAGILNDAYHTGVEDGRKQQEVKA